MENLNLKLDATNGSTLIVLEGQAPKQPEISSVKITGNIYSVRDYLLQRKPNKETSHIEVDRENGSIDLYENQNSSHKINVFGKIEMNKRLQSLGINRDKKYTPKELVRTLKFNKFLFDSPQEVDTVIDKITKLQIKVSSNIGKTQADQTGSFKNEFSRSIEAETHSLVMKCPIYSGGTSEKFTIELWLDVEGQNVIYWLESVSFNDLEITMAEALVDDVIGEIKEIEGFDLPVITK